jgi:hypothetical protein
LGPGGAYYSKQRANCRSGMPVATLRRSTKHPTCRGLRKRTAWTRRTN